MKKTTWFYICTLGIGYLIAKQKAKERAGNPNATLKVSEKIDFPVGDLVSALGGQDNIITVAATLNNLKVKLRDPQVVNPDEIKRLGAKGSFTSGEQITILFGDNSQAIAREINNYLIPYRG